VLRIAVASATAAGVAYAVWLGLDHALGRSFGGQLGSALVALAAATTAYLAACRVLGVRELAPLLSLASRLRRG
jgi:hypothetical protein